MIHFFLNIEKFYESELESGLEVQAVACIEYPIIHVIARTVETMEEEFDELDKFIIQTAHTHAGFTITQFAELTGLGEGVFSFRVEELVKQDYITYEKGFIKPIKKGYDFLNDPNFEREIEKTRSFILDGVTHRPLRSYFYEDGKENLISEEERDSYGNKLFNPAIIHNPPTRNLAEQIIAIPADERLKYSIPVHLKAIKDYDFVLMTYPLPIVFSKTNEGETRKKIVDGYSRFANADDISFWQKSLENEIAKTEVVIEEREVDWDGVKKKKTHFKNNWGNTRTAIEGRVFNITKDKLKYFIQKLFGLTELNDHNIFQNEQEIKLKVDQRTYETEGADKQKLLQACERGRDYYRQYEGIGIWLVFLKVNVGDRYMQGLIELFILLKEEVALEELLKHYSNNYKFLRQSLIAIERYDKLEELDIYLFLHERKSNFNQIYLTLPSE